MPTLLNKIKNRWTASGSPTPHYHIGPITPANHGRWRSRLAKLLGINGTTPLRTASYRPLYQSWFSQPRDLPPFSFETIHSMLMDPGIRLNLAMRAAPIYGVQFAYPAGTDASGKTIYQNGVQAANPAVAAWVQRQLNTIWHNDLPAILRSQVYGWVGGEVSLRLSNQNLIEIDKLVARHPGDIRLLKLDGERYGVKVLRVQEGGEVDLEFPSAWFHAFRPDDGEDYGTSILLGAYSPWADKWFNGGALDTRRLFMHKDAYGGMKIAYPEEEIYIGNELNPVSARDIAAQMVEQRKAGGTITYPSTLDNQGNPKWRVEEATTANNPQHILQYPKDCDDEIRVGMEIPDDVISHDGSGAWAGKRIPLAAFYAGLDTWVVQILADLRKTLEPLILLNWGKAEDFEICHKPLALQAMEAVAPQAPAAAPGAQGAQPGGLSPEIMGAVNNTSGSQRMSLRSSSNTTPHATRDQALDASDRLSPQNTRTSSLSANRIPHAHSGQARARAIATLLTHIYGPDAESYFDEAYGIESSSDSRHDPDRDPYEFKRLSAYISRPISFSRIPWDESKHPRGRDGRFIEKYSADALTHTQQRISESLDPNHVPTTGRTSDDVRNLLDHFNLLDVTQVNTLLNENKVAPDSTGTNPLTNKLHRQIYGEEPSLQKLPARKDIKPQLRDSVYRYSDDKDQAYPFTLLAHHPEDEQDNNSQLSTTQDVSDDSKEKALTPEEVQHNILETLKIIAPGMHADLNRGGAILGIRPAQGTEFEQSKALNNLVAIEIGDGKYLYIDPRLTDDNRSSSPMIFFDPSMSAEEVADALKSEKFLTELYGYRKARYEASTGKHDFPYLEEFLAKRDPDFVPSNDFDGVKRARVSENDEQFQHIVLKELETFSPVLHRDLATPGAMISLSPATDDVIERLPSIETTWGNLYFEKLGGEGESSSYRIYYDANREGEATSELDVARALMSDEFLKAFHTHQKSVHEATESIKGLAGDKQFDDLETFKASRKQAFGEAAVIIHDLLIDVIREAPGGDITYAIYVVSEKGIWEYVKGQLTEKKDDALGLYNQISAGQYNAAAGSIFLSVVGKKRVRHAKHLPDDLKRNINVQRRMWVDKTRPTGKRGDLKKNLEGRLAKPESDDDVPTRRGLELENEAAQALALKGYKVKQLEKIRGQTNPDYEIEGRLFDCYSPRKGTPAQNVVSVINGKASEQAPGIVINLKDSGLSRHELRAAIDNNKSPDLKEVILIDTFGNVLPFYP